MIAAEWKLDSNLIKPITTKDLEKININYIAPRPLKSGLLIGDEFSKISLRNSLFNLKNNKV